MWFGSGRRGYSRQPRRTRSSHARSPTKSRRRRRVDRVLRAGVRHPNRPKGRGTMTSGTDSRVEQFIGCSLVNSDHDRIGEIKEVYLDERTGQPEWFAVRTGMFGNRVSFVPIAGASWDNDDVVV